MDGDQNSSDDITVTAAQQDVAATSPAVQASSPQSSAAPTANASVSPLPTSIAQTPPAEAIEGAITANNVSATPINKIAPVHEALVSNSPKSTSPAPSTIALSLQRAPDHLYYNHLRPVYHQYTTPYARIGEPSSPASHSQQSEGGPQVPMTPSALYQHFYPAKFVFGPPIPGGYQPYGPPMWNAHTGSWIWPLPAPPNHHGPIVQHARQILPQPPSSSQSLPTQEQSPSPLDTALPMNKRRMSKQQQDGIGIAKQDGSAAPLQKKRAYKKKANRESVGQSEEPLGKNQLPSENFPSQPGQAEDVLPAQRGQNSAETPVVRKKRAYVKRKKPESTQVVQPDTVVSPVPVDYVQRQMSTGIQHGQVVLAPRPPLEAHDVRNPHSAYNLSFEHLLGPSNQMPDFVVEKSTHTDNRRSSFHNLDPQLSNTDSENVALSSNGHISHPTHQADFQGSLHISAQEHARFNQLPLNTSGELHHFSVIGSNNQYDGETDVAPEDLSGDDEGFEDNAIYTSIISQVNKYTGKNMNKRGRKAKHRLEDFLGFTETTAVEEAETDPGPAGDEIPKPKRVVRRRGPRIAAEPTPDIKMRLGLANEAFQESNIGEARRLVDEIIRINAETYEAWNLLSSIFEEQNLREDALMALIVAAHLRPKHVEAWFNAADYALTSMGTITPKLLRDVEFCLSSAVRQVPLNIEARIRKAQVLVMRGTLNKAATDYKYILRTLPNNLELIRELAGVYIDLGDGSAGVELYKNTFEQFKLSPDDFSLSIDWNDLHSYAVLYSYLEKKDTEALRVTKSLARWLLGREDETYWDEVDENDCEWDLDDCRRSNIDHYQLGGFPSTSYGEGLPIELRVYFGLYRLNLREFEEAAKHFNYLLGTNLETSEPYSYTYPDLVFHVAESLFDMERFKEALLFYEALKNVPGQNSAELCIQIGKCLLKEDHSKAAEEVLREACLLDETNIEARVELARLYEKMDESEQAFVFVNQILTLESKNRPKASRQRNEVLPEVPPPSQSDENMTAVVPVAVQATNRRRKNKKKDAKTLDREALAAELREQYSIMKSTTERMRNGEHSSSDAWMDAARALTEDFRSCIAFYPWDRKEFGGYSAEEQLTAEMNLKMDVKALAQQYGQNIGSENPEGDVPTSEVPNHYRGITFKDWVEIFCEYALCLARRGRGREAYDICEAATHAICFCFSKSDMFTIHLTYGSCALMANDEETCVAVARWFMTQYQFATDSYRMFAALMRMCHSPISWYSSGPTQKFILRQIKTADYPLCHNPVRKAIVHKDKASYTHIDQFGNPVINEELDVNLLMIYGHILIAGASYLYALNYFHRALTQDPENPMILLALGLSYIQYGLKRQIDNRQHTVMQGFTFMQRYYELRSQSKHFVERQEAHYNMARAYHLVALTNLAVPYYRKVLKAEGRTRERLGGFDITGLGLRDRDAAIVVEDMCVDTAYNLQVIYTVAGNYELAQKITRKWLVV